MKKYTQISLMLLVFFCSFIKATNSLIKFEIENERENLCETSPYKAFVEKTHVLRIVESLSDGRGSSSGSSFYISVVGHGGGNKTVINIFDVNKKDSSFNFSRSVCMNLPSGEIPLDTYIDKDNKVLILQKNADFLYREGDGNNLEKIKLHQSAESGSFVNDNKKLFLVTKKNIMDWGEESIILDSNNPLVDNAMGLRVYQVTGRNIIPSNKQLAINTFHPNRATYKDNLMVILIGSDIHIFPIEAAFKENSKENSEVGKNDDRQKNDGKEDVEQFIDQPYSDSTTEPFFGKNQQLNTVKKHSSDSINKCTIENYGKIQKPQIELTEEEIQTLLDQKKQVDEIVNTLNNDNVDCNRLYLRWFLFNYFKGENECFSVTRKMELAYNENQTIKKQNDSSLRVYIKDFLIKWKKGEIKPINSETFKSIKSLVSGQLHQNKAK